METGTLLSSQDGIVMKLAAFPRNDQETRQLTQLMDRILDCKVPLPTDTPFLLKYLRYNKTGRDNPDSTVAMITSHLQCVSGHLLPTGVENCIKNSGVYVPLKYTDDEKRQIMIFRVRDWDPTSISFKELLARNYYVEDYASSWQHTQVNGQVSILDLSGISLRQVAMVTKSAAGLTSRHAKGMPISYKMSHVVNGGSIVSFLYKIIAPVLTPKIRSRIIVHGSDFSQLHTHIPPSSLPTEYGGSLSREESEEGDYADRILEREEFYRELFKPFREE